MLGGASLLGGRGSFIGAVVGALFLNVIINVLPFLGWSASYGRIMVGVLTLVALSFYQAPELLARFRTFVANVRLSRSRAEPARRRGPGMMRPVVSDLVTKRPRGSTCFTDGSPSAAVSPR